MGSCGKLLSLTGVVRITPTGAGHGHDLVYLRSQPKPRIAFSIREAGRRARVIAEMAVVRPREPAGRTAVQCDSLMALVSRYRPSGNDEWAAAPYGPAKPHQRTGDVGRPDAANGFRPGCRPADPGASGRSAERHS